MSKTESAKYGSTTKTREPVKVIRDDTKRRFKDSDFPMKNPPPHLLLRKKGRICPESNAPGIITGSVSINNQSITLNLRTLGSLGRSAEHRERPLTLSNWFVQQQDSNL